MDLDCRKVALAAYAVGLFSSGLVNVGLKACLVKLLMPVSRARSAQPLRVLITGGSKGIGFALAQEFLNLGDSVVISSRSKQNVQSALKRLQNGAGAVGASERVWGCSGDVTDQSSMDDVLAFMEEKLGGVDVVICNAGCSQGKVNVPLYQLQDDIIERVIRTNMLGTIRTYKAAMKLMIKTRSGGDIFFMEGGGSDGRPTPRSVCYGASKAGLGQLRDSLVKEAKAQGVRVHLLQPGMAMTELMMEAIRDNPSSYAIINILAEKPCTIAKYLVPRVRGAAASKRSTLDIRYLTVPSVIWRFLTFFLRKNRLVDQTTGELVK